MIIIRNSLLPVGKRFVAINLFGILFIKKNVVPSTILLNHERIHSAQMMELQIIPFYLIYVLEWMYWVIRFRDFNKAYHKISFELEAYLNEQNLNYLNSRRSYTQWRIKRYK